MIRLRRKPLWKRVLGIPRVWYLQYRVLRKHNSVLESARVSTQLALMLVRMK